MNRREFIAAAGASIAGAVVSSAVATEPAPATQAKDGAPVDKKQWVAYCALYCGNCEGHTAIPQRTAALRRILRKTHPGSEKILDQLPENRAGLCRAATCGSPKCAIRTCAKAKGIEYCPQCAEYPCRHIKTLAASEPTLLFDGLRLREIGLAKWIAEQDERREVGFCYGDIRCQQCVVPET